MFKQNIIPVGFGDIEFESVCPQCFGSTVNMVNRLHVPPVVKVCDLCKGKGSITAVGQVFADVPKHRSAHPKCWWIYRCRSHGDSRALYGSSDPDKSGGRCGRGGDGYLNDGCGNLTYLIGNACWECEGDTNVDCEHCDNQRLQAAVRT